MDAAATDDVIFQEEVRILGVPRPRDLSKRALDSASDSLSYVQVSELDDKEWVNGS
jgi:hypothetical protein